MMRNPQSSIGNYEGPYSTAIYLGKNKLPPPAGSRWFRRAGAPQREREMAKFGMRVVGAGLTGLGF